MRRSGGLFDHVWFGFRSTACRDPKKPAAACEFGEEKLFLVAEMACHSDE